MEYTPDQWHYLNDRPNSSGEFKRAADDFEVIEDIGFCPSGEGEHIFLYVRKENHNTQDVGERLTRFAGLHPRALSYAGRKDKFAVTEQWFSLHLPGKAMPDWDAFSMEGVSILKVSRHHKKLRTGTLKGNRFNLVLRDLSDPDEVISRLENIARNGVPNYFGEQRFGRMGSNLRSGKALIEGKTIKNRNQRSMAISALRSWLFNQHVSQRLAHHGPEQLLNGDALLLSGSRSYFVADTIDSELKQRLARGDIALSAPLWGKGELASQGEARDFEQALAQQHASLCDGLERLGLEQERRALLITPGQLQWQLDSHTLRLRFELPAGCFATSVIRELIQQPGSHLDENSAR